ncbi:unnamed protein product [Arctia plantaginis]|uniref:Uncharacterized protein n=1 Tax=Arctia plantaginis TaxID=874455 RepID=A0A8S1AG08_ARCPL|nr:unnamed protein product [Arctia plantaginis]
MVIPFKMNQKTDNQGEALAQILKGIVCIGLLTHNDVAFNDELSTNDLKVQVKVNGHKRYHPKLFATIHIVPIPNRIDLKINWENNMKMMIVMMVIT